MRLYFPDERTDLLWKRALSVAAMLQNFEHDLFVAPKEIRYEEKMGKGAFGEVWRVSCNGSILALKRVQIRRVSFSDLVVRTRDVIKSKLRFRTLGNLLAFIMRLFKKATRFSNLLLVKQFACDLITCRC